MGFSVTIASAIILIGLIVFTSVTAATMISTINTLVQLKSLALKVDPLNNVKIDLVISEIEPLKVRFYIRNSGSKPIFIKLGDYNWNSVIISYRNVYWRSYLIENYSILEIRVVGTNYTLDMSMHGSLNPCEEALIEAYLPQGAPEIPLNSSVIVVFASHYGVSAIGEGVRL
ncbi:MAG: hypothetical protein QXX94_07175 [Candidatus Bathyarchaeia archaeon]